MSTLRNMVSDIRSRHKMLFYDSNITDRLIASELRDTALILIKRETNDRKLWNTDTLFTSLPCIEMEEVPLASCCSYTSPMTIARSTLQLPRIAEGIYQYLISSVYNIEGTKEIKYIPLLKYIHLLKLDVKVKDIYFWIHDRYLYCTDSKIKVLRMDAFFEEDIPYEVLYPDCPCSNNIAPCINPLDMEFKVPGYLEKNMKDMVSDTLLKTYERTAADKTSDDIEGD